MDHTEKLTRYVANFVDELVQSGLKHVVISPGSRSTPLALTMCEHKEIKEWVIIDERSAAFFALGIAKQLKEPVALLCTSGTAAANYYPAIVEANYSRVPLLVLTADRSHELRDIGASQAIEQIKMYGDTVKWFHEMALPEASEPMLRYVRSKATQAVYKSTEGNPGPVQLNFPFREPLIPDFSIEDAWGSRETPYQKMSVGERQISQEQKEQLTAFFEAHPNGVIVCGPQINPGLGSAIAAFAAAYHYPVLADPLAQIRGGAHQKTNIIENYDAFLKSSEIRTQLKPDFIIRFGAMPVSKSYLFYLQENRDIPQFVVDESEGIREPVANPTEFIYTNAVKLCQDLVADEKASHSEKWLKKWLSINELAKKQALHTTAEVLMEGEAVRSLLEVISDEACIYAGNSMAVRDLDTFFMNTDKSISVLANRGASGIDGLISSALGAAAVTNKSVTLVIGDLSFYHDLNALLIAKHYQLSLTILLINNDGGGIFSFLPQAEHGKHFEKLFGTPLGIDFEPAIQMYGGTYALVKNADELKEKLTKSYQQKGLHVIEVQTDRQDNLNWRRKIWQAVEKDILLGEG